MAAWVRRQDTQQRLQVVPYQEAPSPPMTPLLYAACRRMVHVVTAEGQVLRAGRACLFVLGRIGWPGSARLLATPPLIWLVEMAYRLVAANRPFFARFLFTK